MQQSTLFIADLHLSDQHEEIYSRFKKFLDNKARNSRALYILGDLFEYYLGDDAISGVAKQVSQDINELVNDYNVQCYYMAGNRDFLLGNKFADMKILNDPSSIILDDNQLIIAHGDALCTDDVEYQKLRLMLRSPQWQQQFLAQSIPERIAFAKKARKQSQQHTNSARTEIMDVNQHAVEELFVQFNCQFLLHGHTHRPAFHNFEKDDKYYQRMVLGDWHYQSSYIEYKNNNFRLKTC